MSRLRILIVDDEPLAVRRLTALLRAIPDVEVAGTASEGHAALELMERLAPDVVLLDIKMPGLDGLEVLRRLGERAPAVIFVTAFAEHAPDAFELAATDYLLKPVEPARLTLALQRARAGLAARTAAERLEELERVLAQVRGEPRPRWERHIWATHRSERVSVPVDELELVTAEGDYVRLFAGGGSYLLRQPIGQLEQRLDPELFLRVHRSAIVRRDRVRRIRRRRGAAVLVMASGAEVAVARRMTAQLAQLFGGEPPPEA
jgi:DNA-binding LytR/AlgR family response regulator